MAFFKHTSRNVIIFRNYSSYLLQKSKHFVDKWQYHRKNQTLAANIKQITAIIQLTDDFSTQLNPGIDGQVWRMNSLFNSNIIYIAVYYLFI